MSAHVSDMTVTLLTTPPCRIARLRTGSQTSAGVLRGPGPVAGWTTVETALSPTLITHTESADPTTIKR